MTYDDGIYRVEVDHTDSGVMVTIGIGSANVSLPVEEWMSGGVTPASAKTHGLDILRAVQQNDAGWSNEEIADYWGVSRRTVLRWLRRAGVPRRSNYVGNPEVRREARRRMMDGESVVSVARSLGVHPCTVSMWRHSQSDAA